MRVRPVFTLLTALAAIASLAAPATAHNTYTTDDGAFIIVLGEQNEPVYTYDWTNLDLFVRDNATGGDVSGVEETLTATLIAPGGEELSMPIEPQFRTVGRYEFENDYMLTQAGQYSVRLEGTINGTDVSGEYLLPGPRESLSGHTFPDEGAPGFVELQEENEALRDEIAALEQRMASMETHMEAMMVDGGDDAEDDTTTAGNNAPGASVVALALAVGAVALVASRRRGD